VYVCVCVFVGGEWCTCARVHTKEKVRTHMQRDRNRETEKGKQKGWVVFFFL
jgi:hypothetical protein